MKHHPLVSCIITFHNEGRFLSQAINSVFTQNYTNWELLLVHELQTFNTIEAELIIKYQGRISYLNPADYYFSDTADLRNFAISKTQGEYIAFIDADDVWLPEKLERQVTIMEETPEAQMVYGRDIIWYDWNGKEYNNLNYSCELGILQSTLILPPQLIITLLKNEYQTATISNALMRRKIFDRNCFENNGLINKYLDQSFFVKVLMNEAVYVSTNCMTKVRTYPQENKSFTEESEDSLNRNSFLKWVHEYCDKQNVNNSVIRDVLKNEIVNLSSHKVKDIIKSTLPDFSITQISYLGQGVHNKTYRINNEYILRTPLNTSAGKSLLREANLLKLLKERVSLRIPEYIHVQNNSVKTFLPNEFKTVIDKMKKRVGLPGTSIHENNKNNMFALYKEIKGSLLYPEFLNNASIVDQDKLAKDIAQFLASMHSVPSFITRKINIREIKFDNKYYKKIYELYTKYLQHFFDKDEGIKIRELFFLDKERVNYSPSLLHGDLQWDHFIFNENSKTIVGVIDFGSVFIGDPAYDFTGMWRVYGERFTRKVIQFYKIEDPEQLLRRIKLLYCCEVLESAVRGLRTNNRQDSENFIAQLKTSSIFRQT